MSKKDLTNEYNGLSVPTNAAVTSFTASAYANAGFALVASGLVADVYTKNKHLFSKEAIKAYNEVYNDGMERLAVSVNAAARSGMPKEEQQAWAQEGVNRIKEALVDKANELGGVQAPSKLLAGAAIVTGVAVVAAPVIGAVIGANNAMKNKAQHQATAERIATLEAHVSELSQAEHKGKVEEEIAVEKLK